MKWRANLGKGGAALLTFLFFVFSYVAIGEYEELRAENKKTKEEVCIYWLFL